MGDAKWGMKKGGQLLLTAREEMKTVRLGRFDLVFHVVAFAFDDHRLGVMQ
jgi:hypothetical protein